MQSKRSKDLPNNSRKRHDLEQQLNDKELEIAYYKKIAEETGKNSIRQLAELSQMIYERNRAMAEREVLLIKERQLTAELNSINKSLQILATMDSLTGVFNRRTILESLEKELHRSRRYKNVFGIIIMDIDFFKIINDTYGHQTGDKVLRSVCDNIGANIRVNDVIGRYGGEEFLIIMPETDTNHAAKAAEKLRWAIESKPVLPENTQVKVTASFGVSSYRQNDDTKIIITRIDNALYESKKNGRNCVTVT
jgi:diguanylate cyclase (GGDEF)-like protein